MAATDHNNVNGCVEAQYVEMMVPLYSYGCERKIRNTLSHFKGIYSVNVDFQQQKVIAWGICNKFDVLAKIKKKRKGARFWTDCEDCDPKINDSNGEAFQDDLSLISPSTTQYDQSPRHLGSAALWRSWSFSKHIDRSVNMVMYRSLSLKLSIKKFFTRCIFELQCYE